MELSGAVSALFALAHEGRLTVFRLLVQAGCAGVKAGDIARQLDMPPNTLSSNLNILVHATLVERRRQGRSIIYSARYENMTELLEDLMQDCCGGAPEICGPIVGMELGRSCA